MDAAEIRLAECRLKEEAGGEGWNESRWNGVEWRDAGREACCWMGKRATVDCRRHGESRRGDVGPMGRERVEVSE